MDAKTFLMAKKLAGSGSGSGLPEVSGSGKALVSVNGEWVEQDGYGYTGTGSETIVSETVRAIVEGSVSKATFTSEFELVAGNTYNVIIGGVTYSGLVAVSLPNVDRVAISDGNAETKEGSTFVIAYRPTFYKDRIIEFTDTSMTGNRTVDVRRVTEVVHKIDSKYLPTSSASNIGITDSGSYYAGTSVEAALQEIGAELSGINTLIGSGVIS